jgi:hypothetical protein
MDRVMGMGSVSMKTTNLLVEFCSAMQRHESVCQPGEWGPSFKALSIPRKQLLRPHHQRLSRARSQRPPAGYSTALTLVRVK